MYILSPLTARCSAARDTDDTSRQGFKVLTENRGPRQEGVPVLPVRGVQKGAQERDGHREQSA